MHRREIVAPEHAHGTRLDRLLCEQQPGLSRAAARRLIEHGEVQVNGRPAPRGQRVAAGDHITLPLLGARPWAAEPDPCVTLCVRYEDAQLVVVDKPAGMPSHPLRPAERGTLASALLARYPEMAKVGYSAREPGLVHRLDTDTSGLVLAARERASFEALRAQLEAGAIDKHYLLLCAGAPAVPAVHHAFLRARGPRVHVSPHPLPASRPITTELLTRTELGLGPWSLLRVRVRRAHRHQIRAQLAALGHPLAADARYGGPPLAGLSRHFLHACAIRLQHPQGGGVLEVAAELPAELRAVLERLGGEDDRDHAHGHGPA